MWMWETELAPKGVVVIVHGAMEHHQRYGWLIEKWRGAGFHVVMGDLPGQGQTRKTRRGHIESFDEYLTAVNEWIEAAFQFDLPVFLLGHSMGGLISIRLLQEKNYDLAGVILSSPCLGLAKPPSKFLDFLSHGLNLVFPKMRIESGITVIEATRNPEVREADLNDSLYVTKVSVRWYRELMEAIKLSYKYLGYLQDVPMLVMQGGEDKIVNKESVREWFSYAPLSEKRFKEWPQCYHEIFNEPERDDVFEYTLDFVYSQLRAIGYVIN